MNPRSATSLSYTRLAVWRCLRGINRPASSQESTSGLCPSSTDFTRRLEGGRGEQSSMFAYLATVPRSTLSLLAISERERPLASSRLISCCLDMGIVTALSFPGAGGNRPHGCVYGLQPGNPIGRANPCLPRYRRIDSSHTTRDAHAKATTPAPSAAHIADNQLAGLETRRMAARFAGLNWPDAKSNTLHGLSNPRQYWADRGRSQYSFSGEDDLA